MILDSKLSAMIGSDGIKIPGLGVIVFRDGKEIYANFFGNRSFNPPKPVTRRTRFRIASVSKLFTAFALMQLVERGKIFLDADAGNYLGFKLRNPNQPQKKISVRMLASHTSSIRDGKIYSIPPKFSVAEFFSPRGKFWEDGAHFAPPDENVGEFFTYSNLNFGLLGTIIERVTGQRFDIFLRENLFAQLDINAEYLPENFSPREFELLGTIYRKKNSPDWFGTIDDYNGIQPPKNFVRLQNPYDENFQGVYDLADYRIGTNATIFSPQGGLRISFEELSHALEMMIGGGIFRGRQILKRESFAEMFKSHWIFDGRNGQPYGGVMLNYGLGSYFVDGRSRARVCRDREINLLGHSGAAYGLLSGIFFVPNTQNGFAYMLNGTAVDEDFDPRAKGKFSDNYIWEEQIMNAICNLFANNHT